MKRTAFASAIAFALAAGPLPAIAAGDDESWEMWEQRQVMKAEIERARRLGGYSDPLTAFRNLQAGTATEADIAPAYGSLEDIPGGPGSGPDRTTQ